MPSILGANTLSGGYDVANSLRFNSGSSDYLTRSLSSAGSLTTFTISAWVKRSNLGASNTLFQSQANGGYFRIQFDTNNKINIDII